MYKCNLCYYSTDRSSNLNKHFKTKKHITIAYNSSLLTEKNNIVCSEKINEPFLCPQIENNGKNSRLGGKKRVRVTGLHDEPKICLPIANFDKNEKNVTLNMPPNREFEKNNDKKNFEKVATKNNICDNCGKCYNFRQGLYRHKQNSSCGVIIEKIQNEHYDLDTIQEKDVRINELENQIKLFTKELNSLKQTVNNNINTLNYNNTTNFTNNITNNIIDNGVKNNGIVVFTFVNDAYTKTKPLIPLKNNEVIQMLEDVPNTTKYTIIDFIVYYYNKFKLHSFLGDIIVKAYKKEDPEEQQIHVSSVMKLSFIVRQVLNRKNVWLKDMNGVHITKCIIDPILTEIKLILQKFIDSFTTIKNMTIEEIEKTGDSKITAFQIIKDITNKTMHEPILRYIAPYFQLNGLNTDKKVQRKKKTIKQIKN